MYSVRFPPDIHSETNWRGSVVAPRRGTMFGCVKVSRYHGHLVEGLWISLEPENGGTWHREHTSLTLCRSLLGWILTRLIRNLEPSGVPSYTYPEANGKLVSGRGSGSVQDFGSTSLTLHIFPSSCRDSLNLRLAGLGTSTRI